VHASRRQRFFGKKLLQITTTAVVLASSLLAVELLAAEPLSVRFQHLSRADGLSSSFVSAIAQDHEGYMWFGTQEGLNCFDGYRFTVFVHDPANPSSISDESVRSVIVDQGGTLWVGTDAGGLSRFDKVSGTFVNYLHDPANEKSIADNRVRVIYEDPDGSLWIGTDGSGLDRFDPASGTFEHFPYAPTTPGGIAGAHVWDVTRDSRGILWVATNDGLSRFDDATGTFTNHRNDPDDKNSLTDNELRTLFAGTDGHLWIGTASGGLNRLDPKSGTIERFVHDPDDPTSVSTDRINTIFEDDAGSLWIGTVSGLNVLRPDGTGFDSYTHASSDHYSLGHDNALTLYQDRGGVLWVGTYDGLSRWNQRNRAFLHYRSDEKSADGLSENTIMAFAESPDGAIWIGTFGGGLNRLDRETDTFRTYRHDPDDENSISSDLVMALHADADGGLWAGTRSSGLNYYDPDGQVFRTYANNPDDPSSLSANGVTSILRDSDDALWVGTFGGGLNRLDGQTGQFERFRQDPEDPQAISSDRVLVMSEDSSGMLWIGTYGGGLNRYDKTTGQFTHYAGEPNRPDGLSGDEIYMINEDANGDLWIAVKGAGLNRWRYEDRVNDRLSVTRYTKIDGLPSNTIYAGAWDSEGRLWMSTGRGLTRMDTRAGQFKNYDTSHGLQDDEFNLSAGIVTSDGEMFFGGINGFNAFRPEEITNHRPPPPVVVTQFHGRNKPMNDAAGKVQLPYDNNVITLEFSALDFAAPEKNRYRYRLEGIDSNWSEEGSTRQVTYTNLPAGDFTFRVIASNNDGVWNEVGARFEFTRTPAPWRTWWAYSLYLIAVSVSLLLGVRAYARYQRQLATLDHVQTIEQIQWRLAEAQRIAGLGNWVWNISSDEMWWSDEVFRLFGYEANSLAPSHSLLVDHIHPDDRIPTEKAMQEHLHSGGAYEIEYRIVTAAEDVRDLHELGEVTIGKTGEPVRVVGTVHDITGRKSAEDNVRHRANFQALLAELSSKLMSANSDDFKVQLNECLESVGQRYDVDAISIRWLSTEQEYLRSRYGWTKDAVERRKEDLDPNEVPWISSYLLSGKPIAVHDVRAMPAEARAERLLLQAMGTKSMLGIPLMLDHQLAGYCMYSRLRFVRNWPEDTVSEITLITGILAGAIARYRAASEIEKLNQELQQENIWLKEEVLLAKGFDEIIGEDRGLKRCLSAAEKVAPTDAPVLILGETGTGKELLARAIHELSSRREHAMVSVNCPALPANLIESELFGHEKGAFTGAEGLRVGRFEMADGGTIFLDEVGELPLELQAKLLRVLQSGEFERLGGTEPLKTDVRLIAATNRDLPDMIERGEFRSDLYYRIGSFPITLPPLRERRGDIPLLAEHFVRKHASRLNRKVDAISARAMNQLTSYYWPGNVRELESIIERALITANSDTVLELPGPLDRSADDLPLSGAEDERRDLVTVERDYIISVLEQANWKVSGEGGAAELLGIPSSTLRSKMKRLDIRRKRS
jgi:transcriptional regulator with GAF, ATPase, and Fis domain/ligand-binding sensor domain-containing protein